MSVKTLDPASVILRTEFRVQGGSIVLQRSSEAVSWFNLLQSILNEVGPLVVNNAFMVNLDQVPVAANNAAAIALGLTAGNLYRSAGNPSVVAIVT